MKQIVYLAFASLMLALLATSCAAQNVSSDTTGGTVIQNVDSTATSEKKSEMIDIQSPMTL